MFVNFLSLSVKAIFCQRGKFWPKAKAAKQLVLDDDSLLLAHCDRRELQSDCREAVIGKKYFCRLEAVRREMVLPTRSGQSVTVALLRNMTAPNPVTNAKFTRALAAHFRFAFPTLAEALRDLV